MSAKKEVVQSGIRATGRMHLGNYLGVLERFAALSNDETKECFFFIADMHTLTTFKEAALIRRHAPDIILDMLAAGVNPSRSAIYIQSHVPIVAELTWYLSCLTSAASLQKLPTFKDKAAKHADDINAGLLFYPVLMAADILGPRADLVPVGEDQAPHLELTREIARRFNREYGDYFPIPRDLGEEMLSVPGLVAMTETGVFPKMGKSEAPEQTIYLNDSAEAANAKIRKAPTDPARVRRTDPGTPSKCAIYQLHTLVSSNSEIGWAAEGCRTADISCIECKAALADNVEKKIEPFRERRRELASKPDFIEQIIRAGDVQANDVFEETTVEVADRMGIFRNR